MNENEKKDLVLGVLHEGLGFIADYVMNIDLCDFSIAHSNGHIIYQRNALSELHKSIEHTGILTYTVETYEGPIILTIKGLASEKLEQGMNTLKDIDFSVKCYFSLCQKHASEGSALQGGVVKYTLDHRIDRDSLINIVNNHCDPNFQYYVSILRDCTKEEQRYMANNLKRTHTFNIFIYDGYDFILVLCHMYNPLTNSIDVNSPSKEEQQRIFSDLLTKFDGKPKFAVGSSCYASDIYLSYQQAKFTMSFMQLTGCTRFSQRYSELGLGLPLASGNWEAIERYCLKNIGALLESDSSNNTSYFDTLMMYLDCNCNSKITAERLYIHVNTLYYRLKKIESILRLSTTEMRDTSHLYYVMKVYGALLDSGLAGESAPQPPKQPSG